MILRKETKQQTLERIEENKMLESLEQLDNLNIFGLIESYDKDVLETLQRFLMRVYNGTVFKQFTPRELLDAVKMEIAIRKVRKI